MSPSSHAVGFEYEKKEAEIQSGGLNDLTGIGFFIKKKKGGRRRRVVFYSPNWMGVANIQ